MSNKLNYDYSQRLGTDMREAKIDAFIFTSARDKKFGTNVASFTPEVFKMKDAQYIANMQNWRCIANQNIIEFTRDDIMCRQRQEFSKEEFESLGSLTQFTS
ncbi:MAG: RES domain-containing protein [Legionella sp.]|nr:RES domain-containing protein [Legionella sp.]